LNRITRDNKYAGYAVVTDGLWRKSVSVVRALGKAGYHVAVMGDTYATTGFWSRYTASRHVCSSASDDADAFGRGLLELLRRYDIKPVLFPMEDASIVWCSAHREEILPLADMLLPPDDSLASAENKADTIRLATRLGIPCPRTYFAHNHEEAEHFAGLFVRRSFVVKPFHGSGAVGVKYLNSEDKINWNTYFAAYGPCLIQERIPESGEALGVSVLMDACGHLAAVFTHKRTEQYPNSGGASTQRISIRNDEVVCQSVKLLESLDWRGVAMVEWKKEPISGNYLLMEINPRFWGSLELAVRSGVNFPLLYARAAQNLDTEPMSKYETAVRCRWLLPGDILRYITKKDRESLRTFMRGILCESEEWDFSDKRIFLFSILCHAYLALNPKYWKFLRR
jgi:predicted ATP-grasp superfamily ATP-dependent carboligase